MESNRCVKVPVRTRLNGATLERKGELRKRFRARAVTVREGNEGLSVRKDRFEEVWLWCRWAAGIRRRRIGHGRIVATRIACCFRMSLMVAVSGAEHLQQPAANFVLRDTRLLCLFEKLRYLSHGT